jgi:hypothetical protein
MTELRKSIDYSIRIVEVGYYTYIGWALPGSLDSDAVWKMLLIDETTNTIIKWADGDSEFNNIWDNYASLTYT